MDGDVPGRLDSNQTSAIDSPIRESPRASYGFLGPDSQASALCISCHQIWISCWGQEQGQHWGYPFITSINRSDIISIFFLFIPQKYLKKYPVITAFRIPSAWPCLPLYFLLLSLYCFITARQNVPGPPVISEVNRRLP